VAGFVPWRERMQRVGRKPDADESAKLEREDEVTLIAIEVFGNHDDAMMWMYRESSDYGPWEKPSRSPAAAMKDDMQ
jgi:uncharacterized protein (DUF2384 family)